MNVPQIGGAGLAVLLALGVTAASAGVGVVSRLGDEERTETAARVVGLKPGEVRRISVTSREVTVSLERTRDGQWTVGPGTPEESATLMFTFEDRLFPLAAFRTLPAPEDEFGLDDPEITFAVTDKDGDELRVAFGSENFTGGAHYARPLGDSPRVYLVPVRMMNDLRSLLAGKQIDRENTLPDKIRELDRKAEERADAAETGFWLRQSLEAGTPVPEGVE